MQNATKIPFDKLNLGPIQAWNEWFLLASGDFAAGKFNAMTVSWGSLGVMWGKPFAQVVVRPTRHTFSFMQEFTTFTLSRFPRSFAKPLALLGSKSGRDGDKIAEAGIHPCQSSVVQAPSFDESELTIECQTMYRDDLNPEQFSAPFIGPLYNNDYHRVYFGEIVSIAGSNEFLIPESK